MTHSQPEDQRKVLKEKCWIKQALCKRMRTVLIPVFDIISLMLHDVIAKQGHPCLVTSALIFSRANWLHVERTMLSKASLLSLTSVV